MPGYYPPVGFHFKVEFNLAGEGTNDYRFQEVSGLNAEITTEELNEGGLNTYSHKLPVRVKYGNLVLKRGMLIDSKVTEWIRNAVQDFVFEPTNLSVTLMNTKNEPLKCWLFTGAYPVKYSISDFKAEASEIVIETLELAYQGFTEIAPEKNNS